MVPIHVQHWNPLEFDLHRGRMTGAADAAAAFGPTLVIWDLDANKRPSGMN